ncbi:MAG: V-type ATPase subunit [Clostridia bacterium]|nr:V-type ATPase subunit [Clostridia bacterium]
MTDYYYESARVRTLESMIVGKERLATLLETKTEEERIAILREAKVPVVTDEGGMLLREETLLALLKSAYMELRELDPDGKAINLWLYPYDCNNIKAAIKAFLRKIDPASMLFDFGTIPASDLVEALNTGNYEALGELGEAAKKAVSAYERTRDPQQIDLILDRACYEIMLRLAKESGVAFALELVQVKIDLVNLMMAIRISRMKRGEEGKLFLKNAFLSGGELSTDWILHEIEAGEAELTERLLYTSYEDFAKEIKAGDGSLSQIERAADDAFMKRLKAAKMESMGPEVLLGFLLGHETEVKNLRILLSGKEAGLDNTTIRERIRESYV